MEGRNSNRDISEESENNNAMSTETTNQKSNDAGFKLILVDLQDALCEQFKKHFAGFPNVEIVNGKFESLPEYDCMVSAGNSFGLMDGGVDAAITLKFGKQLQKRVQQYIIDNFDGEQPVGTSFIIQTEKYAHPYLAHTPTMRVPYSIVGTDYVYLAMKAMLTAVKKHNLSVQPNTAERRINSVACTGLGTFYGKMPLDEAARQMALAYKNFLNPPTEITWAYATKRQAEVVYGGNQGLHRVDKDEESEKSRKQIAKEMNQLAMQTQHTNK